MSPEKPKTTKPIGLHDLILNHANAHAELGNKKKAEAYRNLIAEANMPTMQAIGSFIAKDGIHPLEKLILDLAAIIVSTD